MTREEAIKIFLNRGWIKVEGGTYFDGNKWREAIMVISDYFRNEYKALEQEPCKDCISRQAVLDKAYAYGNGLEPEGFCVNVEDIQALPSVTPQPKTGHWVVDSATSLQIGIHGKKTFSYEVHCDKCGWKWAYATDQKDSTPSNYCPNCGTKMQEVEE